jgi:hypothetical protein
MVFMIAGLFRPIPKRLLRTTETVAVDVVAAGIVTYAAATELKSLLRTK